MIRLTVLLALLCSGALAQVSKDNFAIDKSKPYAYLVFDHIGMGKPIAEGEGPERVYLKVVNNCPFPILFRSSSAPDGEPGAIIEDEVVPEIPMMQIWSTPEEGKAIEQKERDRKKALKQIPQGYASEVSGVLRIQPGRGDIFSVPLNHVSRFWFVRVRFAFDTSGSSIAVGPFTILDFHSYDIPKGKTSVVVSQTNPRSRK